MGASAAGLSSIYIALAYRTSNVKRPTLLIVMAIAPLHCSYFWAMGSQSGRSQVCVVAFVLGICCGCTITDF